MKNQALAQKSKEQEMKVYDPYDLFEIEKESKHHNKGNVFRSEARILLPGKKIMAQSAGNDLFLTVVEIKDKLQQEIKKYKLKKNDLARRPRRRDLFTP